MITLVCQAPSGLWASLLRRTVQQLTNQQGNDESSVALGEALLSFLSNVGQLGPIAAGANLLAGLGLLPALMPLLKDEAQPHLKLVDLSFPHDDQHDFLFSIIL